MTADEDKDPPVPSFLDGISLRRVHDGQVLDEDEAGQGAARQPDEQQDS